MAVGLAAVGCGQAGTVDDVSRAQPPAATVAAAHSPTTSIPTAATRPTRQAESPPRPRIVDWWIPFPQRRKNEMAAYARRHYGLSTYRLVNPRVIIEHYTDEPTARATYRIFAVDRPDSELHELPRTCAHFLVDSDGTIYQFVPLDLMCRHVVGMNYTSIGIEHTGSSDRDVVGNARELRASLALTAWLRCRYGISIANVIGHAEALSSPYHHERVRRLRRQVHDDMRPRTMRGYRARLAALPCR